MKGTSLSEDLKASFRHPAFWAYGTWLDLLTRYRRSFIGPLWMLVPPAMYMFGLGFFFAERRGKELVGFMASLGLGYLMFRLVSGIIVESASVFTHHSAFIMDGNTRLTDYTMRAITKALIHFGVGLPLVMVVAYLADSLHLAGLLPALLGLLFSMVALISLSGLIALFGARYPDFGELLGSAMLLGFVLTPIVWEASSAPAGTVRGTLMRMNPIYHFVEIVRAPLLGITVEPLTYLYLGIGALIVLPMWWWAYRRYSRLVPIWI